MNRCAASRELLFQLPKLRCRVVVPRYRRSKRAPSGALIGRQTAATRHVTMPANIDSGCAAAAFLSFRREGGVQDLSRTANHVATTTEEKLLQFSYDCYPPPLLFFSLFKFPIDPSCPVFTPLSLDLFCTTIFLVTIVQLKKNVYVRIFISFWFLATYKI